jgi:YopX protein.
MRTIKFRAWDGERMIYRGLHDRNWYSEDAGGKLVQVVHPDDKRLLSIMEFSGKSDINGISIYEGDIITYDGITSGDKAIIGEVKYSDVRLRYEYGKNGISYNLYEVTMPTPRIIGNRFSNPELLS